MLRSRAWFANGHAGYVASGSSLIRESGTDSGYVASPSASESGIGAAALIGIDATRWRNGKSEYANASCPRRTSGPEALNQVRWGE